MVSEYTGGPPTYREVCNGNTGHTEVIQITFDSIILSYEELLIIFMTNHNPTTLNHQGADYGTQYRSAIFYHNTQQKNIIKEVIKKLNPFYQNKIITELTPNKNFLPCLRFSSRLL
ncbi:peptide-methionine (S)-S-oxide reductase MsrA [Flavobacterium oreochromis]|uniref:peptide-methionine (S)-S-oxide reductase MsrA n=1 Tax=Flavobacterium oreochromis TaxID=2906078 RepID=UPI003744426A